MRKPLSTILVALALVGLAVSAVLGAGFQIPEQGSASMALGMGYIGRADDLSAMYHNPAGLTQLQGHNFYLTVAGISPSATYTRMPAIATGDSATSNGTRFPYYGVNAASPVNYDKAKTKSDLIPVPAMAYGTRLGGSLEKFAVGFGVNAPYGLSSKYAEDGPQRYMSTHISLTTIYAGPYVAWQATPKVSVGAGVQYVYGKAELGLHANYGGALLLMARGNATLAAALPTIVAAVHGASVADLNENTALDGVVEVTDGSDQGVSANVGVLCKVSDRLQVGATYRKGVALKVEGDVALTVPALVTQATGGLMQSLKTTGGTTVNLPDVVGVGVSYQPTDKVSLLGDFNWNRWSSYKNLDFDFAANDASPQVAAYFPDSKNPRDWENAFAVRLGGEYQLNETQALRLGYLFDQEPIPDESVGPELPTNDRNGITLGYGVKLGKATVDLAYCHLFIKDRTVTRSIRSNPPVGDYTGSANIGGITLSYHL
jgi:long-chain fatty acid transport protein